MGKKSLFKTLVLLNTLALGGIYMINKSIETSVFSKHALKDEEAKTFA